MKTLKKYFTAIVVLNMLLLFNCKQNAVAQNSSVSFQFFYDNLSPYGSWISYPDYGYVWIPSAGPGFFPYSTGGYWTYTEFGWTWVSEYSWGWAPFHYGRWVYDSYYGWIWVPGEEWGPAWVVWRRCPGYYGWAPLAPGIAVSLVGSYQPPNDNWVFVDEHYIGRSDINKHYGPRKDNTQLLNNSTIINNTREDKTRKTTYITGPDKNEIQKVRGKEIEAIPVKETTKPEQTIRKNQLNVFREPVTKTAEAKPLRITDKNNIKPVSERKETDVKQKNTAPSTKEPVRQIEKTPVQKEQPVVPLKKDQPQPVVPDNTRTKKTEIKVVPKNYNKVKEAPETDQHKENVPEKMEEKREPLLPPQKQEPPRKELPVEKPKNNPVTPPRSEPHNPPKQPRQGPH